METKTMKTKPFITIHMLKSIVSAAVILTLCAGCAANQTAQKVARPIDSGFSFAVYGDS